MHASAVPVPPTPTATRDLHPLGLGATPCLTQGVLDIAAIYGQSKVGPADPSGVPRHRGRHVTEQVEAELGDHAAKRLPPQATPAHEAPGREA